MPVQKLQTKLANELLQPVATRAHGAVRVHPNAVREMVNLPLDERNARLSIVIQSMMDSSYGLTEDDLVPISNTLRALSDVDHAAILLHAGAILQARRQQASALKWRQQQAAAQRKQYVDSFPISPLKLMRPSPAPHSNAGPGRQSGQSKQR